MVPDQRAPISYLLITLVCSNGEDKSDKLSLALQIVDMSGIREDASAHPPSQYTSHGDNVIRATRLEFQFTGHRLHRLYM